MGADLIEHATGEHSRAVFVKGGSSNPLVFKGTVTTATSSTVFASTDLTGHGNDAFITDWYVYVFHDAGGAGAAPQGEYRSISDYVSSTGTFTHTAFSANLALTDEVFIIHSSMLPAEGSVFARTGTVYFVGKGGLDANNGKTWETRRLTVASGYGLCSSGDTLIIGPGTFVEDINFNTDGVFVFGRGQGTDGTQISGASTMTCRSNRLEDIFFYDTTGTVVKVGADANANYNMFPNCRIGGAGSAIPLHIDGSVAGGGSFNIFDKCNIYEGSQAAVLIDGGGATGNIFRKCRVRPQTGIASHGIHVNHASTLRNTFIDCVVVGTGATGTGIYFQAGTRNIASNCHVDGITTPYNIAANNCIVGCHEGSLIATNNTTEDDLTEINDRHILYDTVLYVDANSAVGADTNNGSKSSPYLTIAAAVAAASEYTTIICVDSRTGAAAVGFDEDAAITGVTIAKNHITIVGGQSCINVGHMVRIGNTIANADNVFNVTGNNVALVGLAIYLQDINGDEVTVLATGDDFHMECCDLPAEIPASDQNECIRITGNHFVLNQLHTVNSDVGLRCTGTVEIGRVLNSTFQGATEDGILLETGTVDLYVESCQFQSCGDAIDIDAGATYNAFYECNFANNTNIWVNDGGATNQLINAKEESELTAGNTSEDDHKEIYDAIGVVDGLLDVPAKDATTDAYMREVVGKKDDTAQTTVGTTRSIIAYIKGLLNQVAKIPKSDAAVTWNSTALQSIQDEAEDALEGENLDHLQAVTTVAADMTAEVADGSVISRMLSKTSDTSTYDPTTDAQEMISDKLGGFSGDGGAAQDDSTKASLDLAHTDLDAIIVGTITNATAADVATDVVGMRTAADNGYEDMINIVGEGGHVYTAEAATEPGDDVSIMGGLRYVSDMIKKAGGMGGGVATKTLTFTNDGAGTLALFTITGDVIVKIIATCGTLVASAAAANVEVGIPADTDGIISTTVATDIDAGEVWHDATPDSGLEALSTMREYIIANGADIGIKLSGQVDSGVITFHCIWTGLNGGIVVAA